MPRPASRSPGRSSARGDHRRTWPPSDRAGAANVLFEVAHPVADAGDDRASGPMMELVLEYWPNNYMALYHAGMSEYLARADGDWRRSICRAFLADV